MTSNGSFDVWKRRRSLALCKASFAVCTDTAVSNQTVFEPGFALG